MKDKEGYELLHSLKRDRVLAGPYPEVSLFEAANRIMSDLIILHGIQYILHDTLLPFTEYAVQFGNANTQNFDIQAEAKVDEKEVTLIGEAFNVSKSLFPQKKKDTQLKLKKAPATYKLIMLNKDAPPSEDRSLEDQSGIYYVLVNLGDNGKCIEVEVKPPFK